MPKAKPHACMLSLGLSVNVATSCFFGIEADAHEHPDQDLVKLSKDIFAGLRCNGWLDTLTYHAISHFPWLGEIAWTWPKAYDHMWSIMDGLLKQAKGLRWAFNAAST